MDMLTRSRTDARDEHRMPWSSCVSGGLIVLGCVMLMACTGSAAERDDRGGAGVDADAAAGAVAAQTPAETAEEGRVRDDRPDRLRAITVGWNTDWTRHSIPYDELHWGGPPRDGIPSIDTPRFVSNTQAAAWLEDNEPVIVMALEGDARAYPLQIMMWHEIVNDVIGTVPVVVTFCPLCNSAIAFDRRVDGTTVEFGTSGLVRNSDLVMYDRTSESLWQQFTGEGIVGEATGTLLTFLPSSLVSFRDFRTAYPDGRVLSRETRSMRAYGQNPYTNYDTIGNTPFLFNGKTDPRLQAMERVVSVSMDGVDIAYPLTVLVAQGVVNDVRVGRRLAVFHRSGTSSALGASRIAEGRDVGATGVFNATVNGQALTFRRDGDGIVDRETGTQWNIFGQGVGGVLQGTQLTPIVHGDHFWFAWAAFKPETVVYQAQ